MPVSPFMDKDKPQVAELQRTFINNLITPVLLSMHSSGILAGEIQAEDGGYSLQLRPIYLKLTFGEFRPTRCLCVETDNVLLLPLKFSSTPP